MSSISPNLGFTLADGTDTFDNDKYIKGNFQKIDSTILPNNKTIQANGAFKMETISVTFPTNGTANNAQANMTFTNTYTNTPVIIPANITQPENYADTIAFPYFFNTSKTGTGVKIETANTANLLGAGNIIMNFVVLGI